MKKNSKLLNGGENSSSLLCGLQPAAWLGEEEDHKYFNKFFYLKKMITLNSLECNDLN